MTDDQFLSVDALASRWAVSPDTVYNLIRCGELQASKIGRVWRISLQAVHQYEDRTSNTVQTDDVTRLVPNRTPVLRV